MFGEGFGEETGDDEIRVDDEADFFLYAALGVCVLLVNIINIFGN